MFICCMCLHSKWMVRQIMYNYRIYLFREFGYELEEITQTEARIDYYIGQKNKDYSRLLVIKHDIAKNMDIPYVLKFFDSVKVRKRVKRETEHKQ